MHGRLEVEDWHRDPEISLGACRVIYVYNPSISGPRGDNACAAIDGVFTGDVRLPSPPPCLRPIGIDGLVGLPPADPDNVVSSSADDAPCAAADCLQSDDEYWDKLFAPCERPAWDQWEDYVSSVENPEPCAVASSADCAAAWASDGSGEFVPAMPCVPNNQEHRNSIFESGRRLPFDAAVARPVGKKEISEHPKAKEAMDNEWNRLRKKGV